MLTTALRVWLPLHLIALCAVCAVVGNAFADQFEVRRIGWEDLRPPNQGTSNTIFPGIAATEEQGERLSQQLADEKIRVEGYVLPIDRNADTVYEFFLVPWLGACSHAPQPPPNQMVHVIPATPIKIGKAYEYVSVTGNLHLQVEKTQLFIMDGPTVLTSGYSIGRAEAHLEKPAGPPPVAGSPLGIKAN